MSLTSTWKIIVEAVKEFDGDNATTLAAALSFYTALSLAPLLVILMFVTGVIGIEAQQELVKQIVGLVGPQAGAIIQLIINNVSEQQQAGFLSAILGISALVVSAMGVFSQLQSSMNLIWNVEAQPERRGALSSWFRKRLLSLGMMAALGFLMLVSLAISAALNLIFSGDQTGWRLAEHAVSLVIYVLVFALIFEVLPDVKIAWRDVWIGALITGLLFDVGKYAIGKYLGFSSIGSAYGAAGSLVILLVWVYYSSVIMFLGAEFTQVYSRRRGALNAPEEFAKEGNPKKGPQDPEVTTPDATETAPPKGELQSS